MPGVLLYDAKGKPVTVDADAAQAGVLDGTLAPTKAQKVAIRLKDGEDWEIDGTEIHTALANGARIIDPEAERHAKLLKAEEDRGLVGAYLAGPMQAFEGATGGLGPGLIRQGIGAISPEAGKKFQETIEVQREAHPISGIAYNVAGAAGAAAIAKNAGGAAGLLPAAAIDSAGAAVEQSVARAVAGFGGRGLAATSARAAAATSARAATESAIFGAGTHVGEEMLGDHETAGEKFWVGTVKAGAKAGAFGAGLGGVLGGAGGAVKHLRGAATKGSTSLLNEATAKGAEAADEALSAAEWKMREAKFQVARERAPINFEKDLPNAEEKAVEKAFEKKTGPTGRGIAVGPSSLHNPEAYPSPYSVESLDSHGYGPDGQPLPIKAPAAERPFKIGEAYQEVSALDTHAGVREETEDALGRLLMEKDQIPRPFSASPDPMSAGTRYRNAGRVGLTAEESAAPFSGETDLLGLTKKHPVGLVDGIEGLEIPKPGTPFKIKFNDAQRAENEVLRRGGLGMPAEAAPAVAAEAPTYTWESPAAQHAALEAEHPLIQAAQKDLEAARKMAAEVAELRSVTKEIGGSDPHARAAQYAYDALGADKGLTKKINAKGGTLRTGATAVRLGILHTGEAESGAIKSIIESFPENTPEKMLERTKVQLANTGERLGSFAGTEVSVPLKQVLAPLDREIKALAQNAATAADARAVATLRNDLLNTPSLRHLFDLEGNMVPGAMEHPMKLNELVGQRQALQGKVYSIGDPNATALKRAGQSVAGAWGDLEEGALDAMAGTGADFKAAKTDYADLKNIEKALTNRINKETTNRAHGLLDHIVGHAGSAIGGAVLPVVGHVVGGGVGVMLSKTIRERGNAATAVALTKIADIGFVKHVMGQVDASIARAAKGLTATGESKAPRIVGGSSGVGARKEKTPPLSVRYRDAIKELDDLNAHETPIAERAMNSSRDLAQHAPNTANAYALAMTRAVAFLNGKRPAALTDPGPFSPSEPSIPDTQKLSFIRTFRGAQNPMGILAAFERGEVTPEDTEVLKATMPKIYEGLQKKTMEEVAARRAAGKPMPFKQRAQLSMLFDIPADPAFEKANYKQLQLNVSTPTEPVQPKATGGKSNKAPRPVKIQNVGNPLDRLAVYGAGRKK